MKRGLIVLILIITFSLLLTAGANERMVYVSLASSLGTAERDAGIANELKQVLSRKNAKDKSFFWSTSTDPRICSSNPDCVFILIIPLPNSFSIKLFWQNLERTQDSIVSSKNASQFDIAEALAVKIVLMASEFSQPKEKHQTVIPVAPPEKMDQPVAPAKTETPAIPEEKKAAPKPETKKKPEPTESQPKAIPETKKPDKPIKRESNQHYEKMGEKKNKTGHLEINPAFLTGFNAEFITLGLELGGLLASYEPMSFRIDIGFYPYAQSEKRIEHEKVENTFTLLPVTVGAGYRNNFGNWYFGTYIGLFIMQLWMTYEFDEHLSNASDFVMGAAAILESGYNFNDLISLGVFTRVSYTSDDVDIIEEDNVPVFSLPKLQMTLGVSLNLSF